MLLHRRYKSFETIGLEIWVTVVRRYSQSCLNIKIRERGKLVLKTLYIGTFRFLLLSFVS